MSRCWGCWLARVLQGPPVLHRGHSSWGCRPGQVLQGPPGPAQGSSQLGVPARSSPAGTPRSCIGVIPAVEPEFGEVNLWPGARAEVLPTSSDLWTRKLRCGPCEPSSPPVAALLGPGRHPHSLGSRTWGPRVTGQSHGSLSDRLEGGAGLCSSSSCRVIICT